MHHSSHHGLRPCIERALVKTSRDEPDHQVAAAFSGCDEFLLTAIPAAVGVREKGKPMIEIPSNPLPTAFVSARRRFLVGGTQALLSGAAIAMLAGGAVRPAMAAQTAEQIKADVDILNTALGLEYEGIAAYQVGAESGLLKPDVLKLAVGFQSDHKQHAEALAKAISQMGGSPAQPKSTVEYNFPTATLKTQTDVLRFAAGLEEGAVSAYKGAIPLFINKDLAAAGASILGSEAMHWAILRSALGDAPPTLAFVG